MQSRMEISGLIAMTDEDGDCCRDSRFQKGSCGIPLSWSLGVQNHRAGCRA